MPPDENTDAPDPTGDQDQDQDGQDQEPTGLAALDDDAILDTAAEVLRYANPDAFDRITDAEDLAGLSPEDLEAVKAVAPGVADELAGRRTAAEEAAAKTAAEAAAGAKKIADEEAERERLANETDEERAAREGQALSDKVAREDVPSLKARLDDLRATPEFPKDLAALNLERAARGQPPLLPGTYEEKFEAIMKDLAPAEQLANVMGDPSGNPAAKIEAWERTEPVVRERAVQAFGIVPPFDLDTDSKSYSTALQKRQEESAETVRWARDQRKVSR